MSSCVSCSLILTRVGGVDAGLIDDLSETHSCDAAVDEVSTTGFDLLQQPARQRTPPPSVRAIKKSATIMILLWPPW